MLEVIILKEFNKFCDTTYICYINAACTCRSTLGNQLNMC